MLGPRPHANICEPGFRTRLDYQGAMQQVLHCVHRYAARDHGRFERHAPMKEGLVSEGWLVLPFI